MSSQTHESIDDRPTVEPFPSWPVLDEEMVDAVSTVLRSGRINYWTGNEGRQFEAEYAAHVGVDYAIAAANGTVTLDMALHALHIGAEDEVVVTPRSFIASASCVLLRGATPVFADVDRDSQNLTAETIAPVLTGRTKAIILVHLAGWPCEMDGILALAEDRGLAVIEDCAQAHGALYRGRPVGSMGVIGSFSFCQDKILTTGGEGGMVVTNDDDLAWECRSFRDHGYDVKERLNLLEMEGKLMYIHKRVGFNFRMTEIQSQIGLCELKRFDAWNLKNRIRNGKMLKKALEKHPLVLHAPVDTKDRQNSYWWAPFVLDTSKLTCSIKVFIKAIAAEGVPVYSVLWPEMYKERAYIERNGFGVAKYPFFDPKARNIDYSQVDCPRARWMTDRTMCFFTHPVYTEAHMQACVDAFKKVAAAYMK